MNITYSPELLAVTAGGTFLIGIIGTSGNLLAIVALLQSKRLRQNPSTAFMVNLLACLLPICALGMPLFGIGCLQQKYHGKILFPEWFLVAGFTTGLILSQVHLHTICAMAFNRLLAVVWPAVYKRLMLRVKVQIYLALLWLYSTLLWLPLAADGLLKFNEDDLMVSIRIRNLIFNIVHVFITYMLPIVFSGTCYITMYLKVRYSRRSRKVRACRKSVMTPEEEAVRQWDDHVTKTILVILFFLVLCCVPHLVVHVYSLDKDHPTFWLLLHLIFWLQFCLDPIVYVTVSCQYRSACADTVYQMMQSLGLRQWFEPSQSTSSSSHIHPTPVEKNDIKTTTFSDKLQIATAINSNPTTLSLTV